MFLDATPTFVQADHEREVCEVSLGFSTMDLTVPRKAKLRSGMRPAAVTEALLVGKARSKEVYMKDLSNPAAIAMKAAMRKE